MTVLAPKDGPELEAMMDMSLSIDGPCAIRYPRGAAADLGGPVAETPGKAVRLKDGTDVDIWAAGTMAGPALEAAAVLEEEGVSAGVVNIASIAPFDEEALKDSTEKVPLIVTVEDGIVTGGIGEHIKALAADGAAKVINLGWPDKFIEHGSQDELFRKYGLDKDSIAELIRNKAK